MPSDCENLLLNSFVPEDQELLLSQSKSLDLPLRTVLYEAEEPPQYAYFITSGLASVVTSMRDGNTAEVGIIGREGLVGGLHLLGPAPIPTRCFMQLAGSGIRVPFALLQTAFRDRAPMRQRILEFIQEQTLTVSQTAACNRLHEAEERLARWLLMVMDRTGSDVINLTQEFLAQMLGSRRPTVTIAAGALQRAGLIEYQQGQIKVLNRERLEAAACDCYQMIKPIYYKLYQ